MSDINPSILLVDRVLKLKQEQGFNWYQLSKKTGLSSQMLGAMKWRLAETGQGLTFHSAIKIANALDIDLGDIQKEIKEKTGAKNESI